MYTCLTLKKILIFSFPGKFWHHLVNLANNRRKKFLNPSSRRNIYLHIKTFITFCLFYNLPHRNLSPEIICAYIEFLLNSFKSPTTVKNYVASLSFLVSWLGLPADTLHSFQISQMWRAVDKTVRFFPKPRLILTKSQFQTLLQASVNLGPFTDVFRALLVVIFYGMVRISTLLPYTRNSYDSTKHFSCADVKFTQQGALLRFTWAKNRQAAKDWYTVPVLYASNSRFCPVRILQLYVATLHCNSSSQAFFSVGTVEGSRLPLTARQAYSWLHQVTANSSLAGLPIGFYALRRGACSSAFRSGASLGDLKIFGGWRSDSVLRYLHDAPARDRVAYLLNSA